MEVAVGHVVLSSTWQPVDPRRPEQSGERSTCSIECFSIQSTELDFRLIENPNIRQSTKQGYTTPFVHSSSFFWKIFSCPDIL
jgi:hypothetical protein